MPDVMEIGNILCGPSGKVIEGVVSHGMTCITNFLIDPGIFPHVIANAEKSCFCIICPQRFKYPGGYFRDRAVIKGEIDDFLISRHLPGQAWKECLEVVWCMNKVHEGSVKRYRFMDFIFTGIKFSRSGYV